MQYKGYHTIIKYDKDDNIFVGKVSGISDSLNFHGKSMDEVKEMFEQCIDNYLELCGKIARNRKNNLQKKDVRKEKHE